VRLSLEPKSALAILFSLLITALVFLFNPAVQIQQSLGDWGYLGIFLVMLVSSATVILPAPGLLAALAAGASYNFVLVGIAAGLGSALGELTGYMFGYGSRDLLKAEKNKLYLQIRDWTKTNGFLVIFVFSLIPNPAFDIAGIAAGTLNYPWQRFLLSCALGKIIKFIVVAYLGYILLF